VLLDRRSARTPGEVDAGGGRALGKQAGRRHAGQRVRFEAPEYAFGFVHPEIDAAEAAQLERVVRGERERLHLGDRLRAGQVGGKISSAPPGWYFAS
jgi:hypothetical protein